MVNAAASMAKKNIVSTISDNGEVLREYEFSILNTSHREVPGGSRLDEYNITAAIYRYLHRRCELDDGTKVTFTEKNDPQELFFTLRVDTKMSFAEALDYFRGMGLTDDARIMVLGYGKKDHSTSIVNTDMESKFRLGELEKAAIADVNNFQDGHIFFRVHECSEPRMVLFYEQEDRDEEGIFCKTISYMDTKIIKPRFDDVLKVSPFELNPKEKEMLEQVIEKGLNL